MDAGVTKPLYLPDVLDDGAQLARVAACPVAVGRDVAKGDTIVEVQAGLLDLTVGSPVSGRLAKLHVAANDVVSVGELIAEIDEDDNDDAEQLGGGEVPARPSRRRARQPNPSLERIVRRAPLLVAVALGSVALVRPMAGLLVCVCLAALAAAARAAGIDHGVPGPADLLVLPLRLLGGLGSALRANLAGLVGPFVAVGLIVWWLLIAVCVPALAAGLVWLIGHGTYGVLASMRLGVFAYSPRLFAFIACTWLLSRVLRSANGEQRLGRALGRLPEWGLTAAVTAGAAWLVLCATVFSSRTWWPSQDFRALAHSLPAGLRDLVEETRRQLVQTEARAVVDCIARRGREGWREPRAHLLPDGSVLVGIRPDRNRPPGSRSLGVLLLALHNQLAPHRVAVEVALAGGATIRFAPERANRPVTDVRRVVGLVDVSPSVAGPIARAGRLGDAARDDGLACSAAAISPPIYLDGGVADTHPFDGAVPLVILRTELAN